MGSLAVFFWVMRPPAPKTANTQESKQSVAHAFIHIHQKKNPTTSTARGKGCKPADVQENKSCELQLTKGMQNAARNHHLEMQGGGNK